MADASLNPTSHFAELPNPLGESGTHRLHYLTWGNPDHPPVFAVHGLTRNAYDFGYLASALGERFYIIAPDMPGRGRSDWLSDPAWYNYSTYLQDTLALLHLLDLTELRWVGTSMGGILGMMIAAGQPDRVTKLVLNDVGPYIPKKALQRIGEYLNAPQHFESRPAMEDFIRKVYAPFGISAEKDWNYLMEHSIIRLNDGAWRLAYDPGIGQPFLDAEKLEDIDLWPLWEKISCPVLSIRGELSDLLTEPILAEMRAKKPGMQLLVRDGVGHAPALMHDEEIEAIDIFLKD